MDVVRALDDVVQRGRGRPLPSRWRRDARFGGLATVDEVISAVRGCDRRSDEVLGALIDLGSADATAPDVTVAALLRLGLSRCGGDRERVDALVAELALVLAEAWAGDLPMSSRRLVGVMIDRAWGRVRAAERKGRWIHTVDVDAPAALRVLRVPSPEDVVVAAVAIEELRGSLRAGDPDGRCGQVARAWDAMVELVEQPSRSERDRNRWRYARSVLRRHLTPDLELVDVV